MDSTNYERIHLYFRKGNKDQQRAFKILNEITERGERVKYITKAILAYEDKNYSEIVPDKCHNDDLAALVRQEISKLMSENRDSYKTPEVPTDSSPIQAESEALDDTDTQAESNNEPMEEDDEFNDLLMAGLEAFQ